MHAVINHCKILDGLMDGGRDDACPNLNYVDPPVGCWSTYCFTDFGVGVGVGVGVTPITKAPPAQIFFGRHVFCSPGH